MRSILSSLAPLVVARLAQAGTILYATAATTNGVDGFCLGDNGALRPSPWTHVDTGDEPRRLIVGGNRVLYVVERNGVEAFEIRRGGRLGMQSIGSVRLQKPRRMNPQDAVLSPDGR